MSDDAGSPSIRRLRPEECRAIAELDVTARTTATLGFLGPRFYTRLYRGLLADSEVLAFVALHHERPVGFVIGAVDGPRAMRAALRRQLLPLALIALGSTVRRPARAGLLLAALRYPARGVGPELLVISVDPAWQRHGVAKQLVAALDAALSARGIARYRVSTKVETTPAMHFYEALGFTRADDFVLFDERWVVFERALPLS